jgi:hypothetical protein
MPSTGGNSPNPTLNEISKTPPIAVPPDSVRHQPSEGIRVGQHFPCFQDFKKQILRWAVQDGFKTRYLKSNGQFNIVVCAEKACTFKVRAHWKKASERVEVTIVNPNHTVCIGMLVPKREAQNHQAFLLEAVMKVMTVHKTTTAAEVIRAIGHHYTQTITYHAAHRALKTLQNNSIDVERAEFRLLTDYVNTMHNLDPNGHYDLSTNSNTHRFQRLFVCPSSSHTCFRNSPPFLTLDGTFTTSKFRQTLLFAVCPDSNNEVTLLSWALAESENEDSWRFFCRKLKEYVSLTSIALPSTNFSH